MDLNNFTFSSALMVALSGIAVVLVMLSILWGLIVLLSKVVGVITRPKKTSVQEPAAEKNDEQLADDSEDLVLITAAIAAYLGSSPDQLIIKSTRKVSEVGSAWKTAARASNIQ